MHACSRVRNIKIRVGKRTFFAFKLKRRQLNATMGPNCIATHCLISSRKGLGLATIDPHRRKEHTEIHKIPHV